MNYFKMGVSLKQGDIIICDFDPQSGHEQAGRRSAIVVSKQSYNEVSTVTMVCPITSTSRDWAFFVELPKGMQTHGKVFTDQVKTFDLKSRRYKFVEEAPHEVTDQVMGILESIMFG
jgi:mRNA interferase MazF